MADNITALANTGTGTDVLATDDIGGVHYPRTKIAIGADGVNNGDVSATNPLPVSEPPLILTGAAAQTAIVNNILSDPSGAAATDVNGYRTATIQVVSTGTGGTFIFEQSNDNVNFRPLPVFNAELTTGVPIVAAITATASQIVYSFPIRCRFLRLRIVSTITGGSIRAFTRLSTEPYAPAVMTVAQPTGASLNTIVSGNVGVTGTNIAAQQVFATDASLAALTTTTTTPATTTSSGGLSYSALINVTTVSGTSPTLDVGVEESEDNGTSWFRVYDFPRITATGQYRSPRLPYSGNRVRYVQTVGGTAPSFTRAITRVGYPAAEASCVRQIIDRTISLTTLNSVTPSLHVQNCSRAQLAINIGAATTPPAIQLEGSDDSGASWYAIGSPLTAVASSTVTVTSANVNSQLIRARVSTAGATVTPGYVLLKGF